MFGSAIIEVAIGLAFSFLLVSLAASAAVEWIGTLTKKRAKHLLRGLQSMLDSPQPDPASDTPSFDSLRKVVQAERALYATAVEVTGQDIAAVKEGGGGVPGGLTALLFDHPLVRATLGPRAGGKARGPAYLSPRTFAQALVATLVPDADGRTTLSDVRGAVAGLDENLPARSALLALIDQTRVGLDEFRDSLEQWYDGQMDRVSGWYRRWTKRWLIAAGIVVAVAANADALTLARTLYEDAELRESVVASAEAGAACRDEADPAEVARCVRDQVADLQEGRQLAFLAA